MDIRMSNIASPMPQIRARFTSKLGIPLSGCKVYTYEPNSDIPKTTWIDTDKTVENTNPILLDSAGEADIFLDGLYRVVVKDRFGFVVYDVEKTGTHTEWDASFVVYNDIPQKKINDGLESIAEMLAIQNPFNGMRVYVKSYHAGLNKGGGTFVYNSAKALINDGVVCFNGWVRASFVLVTSAMAGCVIDGASDDTQAFQRGVDYTAQNGFPLYVDEGVHYLNTCNFIRWNTEHQFQTYCPIIELKYSGITVLGLSKKSVLKYGDGITTSVQAGINEFGYVGAQLFASNPSIKIDDFTLDGVTIDGNGYNNKIIGVNQGGYGSAAGNQAVALQKGDRTTIRNNVFKNLSGYQVLYIAYDVKDTLVEANEFIDAGWLDGTNWVENYTDQSTVYLGGTFLARNNRISQSHDGMYAGTAFEMHGIGTVVGNHIQKYACAFLTAGSVRNPDTKILANSAIDCTMFLSTYQGYGKSVKCTAIGNYFRQNTMHLSESTIYGKYRGLIFLSGDYNPLSCKVNILSNTIETDGVYAGSSDAYLKSYNSLIIAQHVNELIFKGNIVKNHKGSLLKLLRQPAFSNHLLDDNQFFNCGVDFTATHGNSIVYYTNDDDVSYGNVPEAVLLSNNKFFSCRYGQYFDSNLAVVGAAITPSSLRVDGDIHTTWIAPLLIKSGEWVRAGFTMTFNYKVNGGYNADNNINKYFSGYNAARQSGLVMYEQNGLQRAFTKTINSLTWVDQNQGEIVLSADYDPASIPPNAQIEYVFNDVVGAKLGMSATPTFDKFLSGVQMWAQVTANQQVVVYFRNGTASAVDIPSGTITVKLI